MKSLCVKRVISHYDLDLVIAEQVGIFKKLIENLVEYYHPNMDTIFFIEDGQDYFTFMNLPTRSLASNSSLPIASI